MSAGSRKSFQTTSNLENKHSSTLVREQTSGQLQTASFASQRLTNGIESTIVHSGKSAERKTPSEAGKADSVSQSISKYKQKRTETAKLQSSTKKKETIKVSTLLRTPMIEEE